MATKQAVMDAIEDEVMEVDRSGEPPYITRGVEPVLPMRHWRISQPRIGEKLVNATTMEEAIRTFNMSSKSSYARSLLVIDEVDRAGKLVRSDAEMKQDAAAAKERYRLATSARWEPKQPIAGN